MAKEVDMKFLLKVRSNADILNGYGIVIVEIDRAQREQLLRRRAAFQATRSYEPNVYSVSYWDSLADWCESTDPQLDAYFEKSAQSDDPYFINTIIRKPITIDCAQVIVTDTGVYWEGMVKHTSVLLETVELPWESLEVTPA